MKNPKFLIMIAITLIGCLFLASCSNKGQKNGIRTDYRKIFIKPNS